MKLTIKGIQTKSKILQVALELFSTKGYNGTTTREIALQSGFAEGTIFRYFPNKKSLLHSILEPLLIDSLNELQTTLSNVTFLEALEQIVKQRLKLIEDNWLLFKLVFFEIALQPELRAQIILEVFAPMQITMVSFMQKHIDQGHIRTMNPYIAVQLLLGMLVTLVIHRYSIRPVSETVQLNEQEYLQEVLNLFYQGVKAND